MVFDNPKRKSDAINVTKARKAKIEHKEVTTGYGESEDIIDERSNNHLASSSDMSWECLEAEDSDDPTGLKKTEPMEVDEAQNSDPTIPFIQAKIREVEEMLEHKTSEISIFSEECFLLRNESISIKSEKESLESKMLSLARRLASTKLSRDSYKRKTEYLLRKVQRTIRSKFRVKVSSVYSTVPRRSYKYSTLSNSSSKNRRKKEAVMALQRISMEDDIHALLDDIIMYCDKSPLHSFNFHISVWQAVIMKTKVGLSLAQIAELKKLLDLFTGKDFLPSVHRIANLAKSESMIHLFEASIMKNPSGKKVAVVQCSDIDRLIQWKLEKVSHKLLSDDFTGDYLVLAVGIDAGGGSTKVCLMFGNLEHPSSLYNLLLLGMYSDEDDYHGLVRYIRPLIDQINRLHEFSFIQDGQTVTKKVRPYFIGDFKAVSEVLGHAKQSCTYFCHLCEATNCNRGARKSTIKDLDIHSWPVPRTMSSYNEYSADGVYGVRKGHVPLFENIPIFNHLPGMLHCVMGLFEKYVYWPLWQESVSRDNLSSFAIHPNKASTMNAANHSVSQAQRMADMSTSSAEKKQRRVHLEALLKNRELLVQAVNGVNDGYLRTLEASWETLGASRRAYFQVYNGNHTFKILSNEGVKVTFKIFEGSMKEKLYAVQGIMEQLSFIMSSCVNRILKPPEIEQLRQSISLILRYLKDGFPEESITQKLHYLVYHLPEIANRDKTIGKINEQGMEAAHARMNNFLRRFACIQEEEKRFLHCVQEMMCLGLSEEILNTDRETFL